MCIDLRLSGAGHNGYSRVGAFLMNRYLPLNTKIVLLCHRSNPLSFPLAGPITYAPFGKGNTSGIGFLLDNILISIILPLFNVMLISPHPLVFPIFRNITLYVHDFIEYSCRPRSIHAFLRYHMLRLLFSYISALRLDCICPSRATSTLLYEIFKIRSNVVYNQISLAGVYPIPCKILPLLETPLVCDSPIVGYVGNDKAYKCIDKIQEFCQYNRFNFIPFHRFFPLLPRDDSLLVAYYKFIDIYAAFSLEEGFCYPIYEASIYGCDVIARDIPVFREAQEFIPITLFSSLPTVTYKYNRSLTRAQRVVNREILNNSLARSSFHLT